MLLSVPFLIPCDLVVFGFLFVDMPVRTSNSYFIVETALSSVHCEDSCRKEKDQVAVR